MTRVFADASYWIGLANKRDSLHDAAKDAREKLGEVTLVTTDEVLTEFLNGLSARGGPALRKIAVRMVRKILGNPNVDVRPQTRGSFMQGLALFEEREDKEYSLTDCISMIAMRTEGLAQALTSDHHFAQEGFEVLMSHEPPSDKKG